MVDGRVQEASRGDVVGKREDEGALVRRNADPLTGRDFCMSCFFFLEAQDCPSKFQATLAMGSVITWEMWPWALMVYELGSRLT